MYTIFLQMNKLVIRAKSNWDPVEMAVPNLSTPKYTWRIIIKLLFKNYVWLEM